MSIYPSHFPFSILQSLCYTNKCFVGKIMYTHLMFVQLVYVFIKALKDQFKGMLMENAMLVYQGRVLLADTEYVVTHSI